jgi:hypothetical protein
MTSAAYSDFLSELFELAALVPCRSEQLAAKVARLGCPERKTRLMRTVLPDLPFAARNPPGDGAWRILQAARLVPKKGLATASRFFPVSPHVSPRNVPDLRRGTVGEDLRKLASDLGLRITSSSWAFFHRLRWGTFFAATFSYTPERMLAGISKGSECNVEETSGPVVARVGGIPEVIEDERMDCCATRKKKPVASALLRLANDPVFRRNFCRLVSVREGFRRKANPGRRRNLQRGYCCAFRHDIRLGLKDC